MEERGRTVDLAEFVDDRRARLAYRYANLDWYFDRAMAGQGI